MIQSKTFFTVVILRLIQKVYVIQITKISFYNLFLSVFQELTENT